MATVNLVVKVHPAVLFSIADSYERRNADSHRVIGTLVGSLDKQSIEVTNCFCIPHKEYEERVEADIVYAQEMFELNKKVAPHEALVGWFATGSDITSHSALIHDYYARETKDPIHLTLDTTLNSGRVNMKAYVFVPIGVPGATSGSMFTPVKVEMIATEPEVAGLDLLHKTKHSKIRSVEPLPELKKIAEAADKIEMMLDIVLRYVEAVLAGTEEPDTSVGRALVDLVQSVPKMDPVKFEAMLNSNMRDLLMVVYLSSLTKTQLQLNEKLSMVSVNNIREMSKFLQLE
jgi:translation initiation factor 3 subunit F